MSTAALSVYTSAMQGIFGASLRDVVVMQHCLCIMCIYWNELLIAAKVIDIVKAPTVFCCWIKV